MVERDVEQDPLGRLPQPPHVPVIEEGHTVVRAQRLVNALSVDEAMVVDRHDGLVGRGDLPVDVYRSTHNSSDPSRAPLNLPTAYCILPTDHAGVEHAADAGGRPPDHRPHPPA